MMERLLNERVKSISPSGIRKFFDIANQMENVISLGVGEPDFRTPWHVRAEAVQSIEQKGTSYTANAGLLELRKAISKYLHDRFHLEYHPENQILVTVGASEAVDLALRAIVDVGDEILILNLPMFRICRQWFWQGIPVPVPNMKVVPFASQQRI